VNGDDAGEDESDEGGGPYPWQQLEEPTSEGAIEVVEDREVFCPSLTRVYGLLALSMGLCCD
jgi:hypothetical protein